MYTKIPVTTPLPKGQMNNTERKKIRKRKIMNAAILERKICGKKL
jgi:hypothetical protein